MTSAPVPPRRAAVAALRWIVPAALVLGLTALALTPDARAFLGEGWEALTSSDPAVTRAFVEDLGWAGPLALLAGFVLQAAVPVLPALVMTAVTARAYGPVEGFLLVYLGTLLGAAAGYGLGRALGDTLVRALAGERARQTAHIFAERYGLQGVLLVRLMPVLSADVLNLVAGAAGMGFRPFMGATAAGALPVTALVVWLSGSAARMAWGLGLLSAVVGLAALGRWWLLRRSRSGASG